MKYLEYYYNIFYYFFYRGAIKSFYAIDYMFWPLAKLFYSLVDKFPAIRRYYVTEEHDNPEQAAKARLKKITENPKISLGTIVGHGLATSIIFGIYFGCYHIIINIFFPTSNIEAIYTFTIFGILAYGTDIILTQNPDQGIYYIKQFNKKTGWWRVKWAVITILSPFFAIWFALTTTSEGDIGRLILSLKGYSSEQIYELNYYKITGQSIKQSEQDILNQIRQHSPSNNERY